MSQPALQPTATAQARAQAAQHLLRLRRAQETFLGFVQLHHPDWEIPDFHRVVIEALDRLDKDALHSDFLQEMRDTMGWEWSMGDNAKIAGRQRVSGLLITMPPRHSKTTLATILYPAWVMARDPRRFIMSCSYNAELAKDFGRQAREIAGDPRTAQAFPGLRLSADTRAADVWGTADGGKYFGTGIGGTTAGRPANLLLNDDLLKAREEAESISHRNKVWSYYTSSLVNRLQPEENGQPPRIVCCQTRWHPDDHAGRLIASDDWREGRWLHINMPAIRDEQEQDATKVQVLWPARFDLDYLQRRKRLNPREFASLFQQSPYVQGGNIIKAQWWRSYDQTTKPDRFASVIIAVDSAFKRTDQADYSVALIAGLSYDGSIFILDVVRGKWEFPDLKRQLISLNARWRGKGLRAIYIEDKASGQSLIQELKRESGLAIIPHRVVHDKVARVQAITPMIEGGIVWLPQEAPWLDDFTYECQTFPGSAHDDQVDALSMALDVLSRQTLSVDAFDSLVDSAPSLNEEMARERETEKGGRGSAAPAPSGSPGTPLLARRSLNRQLLGKTDWRQWKGWGL